MTPSLGRGYISLARILSRGNLYAISPALQALALVSKLQDGDQTGGGGGDWEGMHGCKDELSAWRGLQRALPVHVAPDEVAFFARWCEEERIGEERTRLGVLVLVDAQGRCRILRPLADLMGSSDEGAMEMEMSDVDGSVEGRLERLLGEALGALQREREIEGGAEGMERDDMERDEG